MVSEHGERSLLATATATAGEGSVAILGVEFLAPLVEFVAGDAEHTGKVGCFLVAGFQETNDFQPDSRLKVFRFGMGHLLRHSVPFWVSGEMGVAHYGALWPFALAVYPFGRVILQSVDYCSNGWGFLQPRWATK